VAHGTFLRCVALGTSLIKYVYGDFKPRVAHLIGPIEPFWNLQLLEHH
jgi:hypothetical protein